MPGLTKQRPRDIMHPMFVQLFIESGAHDLPPEEDRRPRAGPGEPGQPWSDGPPWQTAPTGGRDR